ncbi:3'-5' exonuclease [Streptomyces coelicoflavus]|uniref:3'-5' exonuclease n=1 Tax=Streptomyces coelicoflavus TaxID=285562 RepID=UPI00363764FE
MEGLDEPPRYYLQHGFGYQCHDRSKPHHYRPARPGPHRLGGGGRTQDSMNFATWPALLVVDVEGNGTNPPDLVETAALPVRDGRPDKSTAGWWLTRPHRPITPFATRVHGLTNTDLADKPAWADVADRVRAFLGNAWICAHHAHTDYRVLGSVFK